MSPRKRFDHLNGGLPGALGVIGEWWTPLVVWTIHTGSHRFEEIQVSLGTARNILTDRLSTLVTNGVLEKRCYSERPMRYEYHLTDMGHDLIPVLKQLEKWGNSWLGQTSSGG
jgi:DNA-binding HxlR family transcriptional regulator